MISARQGQPEEAFDGVLCSSVIEYVRKPDAAVREFHRVLKKDGIAVDFGAQLTPLCPLAGSIALLAE